MNRVKYLFYDLEYASSKGGISKICEFGYVLTDESFNVLERDNFIIDPYITREEWDWRVVRKILTRKVSEYESSPRFDEYYDDIKKLILNADYVLGHSLNSDAKALNQDCERYDLHSIDYDFYDIKLFYKQFSNTKKDTSVTNMLDELKIEGEEREHDAETDAFNTMLELKQMMSVLSVSLFELIELVPEAKDRTENYKVKSIEENRIKREIKLKESLESGDGSNDIKRYGENRKRYIQFLDNVKPQKEGGGVFNGKKVSISVNYEEHHFRQMLNLIQLITDEGGTVILKGSLSDVFAKYDVVLEDGSLRDDSKLKYVMEANENGSNIEIIDFSDLLCRLSITEDELDNMPMPSFDFLFEEGAIVKDRKDLAVINRKKNPKKVEKVDRNGKKLIYSSGDSASPTLGDLFGDIPSKFLEDEDN